MHKSVLLLSLIFAISLRAEVSLPPAPSGCAWQRLPEIKGALLKPDGWFFKEIHKGQTDAFFITKENIEKSGTFRTGLTLNCVRNIPKKSGRLPSAYAASIADAAAAKHQIIERSTSQQGPF